MLLVPSVEVTKGEPRPFWLTLHPLVMVGGLVAVMRKAVRVLLFGAKNDIRARGGPVGGRRLNDSTAANMRLRHRQR